MQHARLESCSFEQMVQHVGVKRKHSSSSTSLAAVGLRYEEQNIKACRQVHNSIKDSITRQSNSLVLLLTKQRQKKTIQSHENDSG